MSNPENTVEDTARVEHDLFFGAGDVRSDATTIAALRQGVGYAPRVGLVHTTDHCGDCHDVPLVVVERAGLISVEVHKDLVAEVASRAAGPRRRTGTVQLGSVESLIEYVNRFKGADTVAFAPLSPPEVTVVFDYHPEGSSLAGWRDDRATYRCPLSRQWKLWNAGAETPMGQAGFGDLIEENADDIGPGGDEFANAPDLLKCARELSIRTKGVFERKINPTTGEGTLVVKDEHEASSTKIPRAFRLAIPVFEGSADTYAVEVRLRFTMADGGRPSFSYALHNAEKVMEHALGELRAKVAAACSIPVYVGQAPTGGSR